MNSQKEIHTQVSLNTVKRGVTNLSFYIVHTYVHTEHYISTPRFHQRPQTWF